MRVNGAPAKLGERADPERDHITVDGRPVRLAPPAYWLVHKPRGVTTTVRDPHARRTVLELVPEARERLFPVGRLDLDTEGLVLLTNDGELAQVLLHPSLGTEREYRVTVRGRVAQTTLRRLARGVELEDGRTAPARVGAARYHARADVTSFGLTLREGRKRQIRRALRALGHPVVRLVRTRMGPLRLGRLGPGQARVLEPREVAALRRHARARRQAVRGSGETPATAAGKSADGRRKGVRKASTRSRHGDGNA